MLRNNKLTAHLALLSTGIFLCFIVPGITSCQQQFSHEDLEKIMGERFRKKIQIPEQIQLVNEQSGSFTAITDTTKSGKYKVIHFFTADCDKCVHELTTAQKFIDKEGKREDISYFFIASGPTAVFVKEAIAKSAFTQPVYFEKKYYSFKMLNNLPAEDKKYNTMLVNDKNELLLFGAFFDNKKAQEYLFKTINNHI